MAQPDPLGKSARPCHIKGMADPRDRIPASGDGPASSPAGSPVPQDAPKPGAQGATAPAEIGGPKGPEPTRYGDWEVGGRCSDF